MLKQIFSVTGLNLRSLSSRVGLSLVIIIGIAGVVGVLISMLSMATGLDATLKSTGRPDRVIVLRGGSNTELNSGLDRASVDVIKETPGVRPAASGKPLAAAEMIVISELPSKSRGGALNVTLRGVEPESIEMRQEFKLLEGAMFEPGLQQIVVGKGVLDTFDGVNVGSKLQLRGAEWSVVGVFTTGDSHDSEMWVDLRTAQTAFNRQGSSSVVLQLPDAEALAGYTEALKKDPRVNVDVQAESDYFSGQNRGLTTAISRLAVGLTIMMGLGALFAAWNTMYAAVAARTRQIATLRAIGFGGFPVAISVLIEAMALAMLGGILGAAIAWLLFNNFSVSTLGANFTQVVFSFKVTVDLVIKGLVIALLIGLTGGLLPAIRAARLPVTTALRAG